MDLQHPLSDLWPLITSFARDSVLFQLSCVSRSMNAVVWSGMKRINFGYADVDPSDLLEYLKKSPSLQTLSISAWSIPQDNPQSVASSAANLTSLQISGWCAGWPKLFWTNFKFLQSLKLNYSPYANPFPADVGEFHHLTHLEMDGPATSRQNWDSKFLSAFPNLTSLKIWCYNRYNCDWLPIETLVKLKALEFIGYANTSYARIEEPSFLSHCQNLNHLTVTSVYLATGQIFSSLQNLQSCHLNRMHGGNDDSAIRNLSPTLRVLNARSVSFWSVALKPLTALQKLVYWISPSVHPDTSDYLQQPTLKSIKYHTNLMQLSIRHRFTHHISRLKNLVSLKVFSSKIGDQAYHIRDLTQLTLLYLPECQLTSQDWGYLTSLTNLRHLSLAGNKKIDEYSLTRIRLFPALEMAAFSLCPLITGRTLGQITHLVHLQTLVLEGTSLKSKYFSFLTKLKLTNLDVSKTPIDDNALRHLKAMTSLITLNLNDCPKVSRTGPSGARETTNVNWEVESDSSDDD